MILQEPATRSPECIRKSVSSKSIRDLSKYDGYSWSHGGTPEYRYSDLHKVSHLGEGAFSKVSLVVTKSNKDQLAMKSLDPSKLNSQNAFVDAAVDLAREANILSKLDHENIIRLRGVPSTSLSESFAKAEFDKSDAGYFILLDTIEETLQTRMSRWRRDQRRAAVKKSNKFKPLKRALSLDAWKKKGGKTSELDEAMMKDRMLLAAVGVARGMQYLHGQGIIMQDLSACNIGFDQSTGEPKIFDFGLAHKVDEDVHALPSMRQRGLICGTPRYMAPEVMQHGGGSKASDVFSFGVLLYEICTLHSFFASDTSLEAFEKRVISGERPSLDNTIPYSHVTKNLISSCWAADPKDRPSFDEVVNVLVDILTVDDTVVQENKAVLSFVGYLSCENHKF